MPDINNVTVMGRLVDDPELRATQGGSTMCIGRIAIDDSYKDRSGEWQNRACFIGFTIWGKSAERFGREGVKGAQVFLHGSLQQDEWEDKKTGQKRSAHKIKAFVAKVLQEPAKPPSQQQPQPQYQQQGFEQPPPQMPQNPPGQYSSDDIPF